MINLCDGSRCTGCSACYAVCSMNAIRMQEDKEGFIKPLVDHDKCVECGKCTTVCPVLHPIQENNIFQQVYLVQHKNQEILKNSTSGGAFTALANAVLQNGGIVFGAALNSELEVEHICINNESELERFQNSKYVQSNIGNTFRECRENLEAGKSVLYSGTPCQIEGLLNYLENKYDNLYTVDVVCHAVPSRLVYRKYKEMQQKRFGNFRNILFRNKHYGYKYSTLSLFDERGKEKYHAGIATDPFLRAFFSNICDNKSCYNCQFKKRYRRSDITLWDCLNVERFDKEFDNDRGVTRMLIHSRRGIELVEQIITCRGINIVSIDTGKAVEGVYEMFHSVVENDKRYAFLKDAGILDGEELFNKYFPIKTNNKIEHVCRVFFSKFGGRIYKKAKGVYLGLRKKTGKEINRSGTK